MQDYWLKQTLDKPLFPDLLWSRPENKNQAGKLLIIGGNPHSFAAVAEAYAEAAKAGIGSARVLLPDSLQKIVGKVLAEGEYAPSTPSGSFSQKALSELLVMSQWADGVLLAGDLGRNSETAILLEKFTEKYSGQLTITKDAVDYFKDLPNILDRAETTLVLSFAQLQKLATSARTVASITFDMDFLRLIDWLHEFSSQYQAAIVTKHLDNLFVALNGQVSTTKLPGEKGIWRVRTAAHSSVWWLQNPAKPFQSLATAVLER